MKMQIFHYFNEVGEYAYSMPNPNVGAMPPENATELEPAFEMGYWPVFVNGAWTQAQDHRKTIDNRGRDIDGTGTPYWLNGDNYQSPARYMTTVGPLPAGVLLAQPEKTQAERDAERRTSIKSKLMTLDAYLPRSVEDLIESLAVALASLSPQNQERHAHKVALRAELAGMG